MGCGTEKKQDSASAWGGLLPSPRSVLASRRPRELVFLSIQEASGLRSPPWAPVGSRGAAAHLSGVSGQVWPAPTPARPRARDTEARGLPPNPTNLLRKQSLTNQDRALRRLTLIGRFSPGKSKAAKKDLFVPPAPLRQPNLRGTADALPTLGLTRVSASLPHR